MLSEFEVDGFTLKYAIEGSGPTALVIGSAIYYPRTFSQNLRAHLRMVFMDHRGFGEATKPFEQASFELDKILDDIEALRQMLGLEKIIIIGHSGHAYMAIEYAKKFPHAVSHVLMLAISPDSSVQSFAAADRYFQESVCPERKVLLAKNMSMLEEAIAANPKRGFITRMLKCGPMIWYKYDFDAEFLWKDIEVIPEMFEYVWGKVFRELDITAGVNKLYPPVFIALGRYDYWNPPYLWEGVRTLFSNLTLRVFEKSAHTPQLEEPNLFDAELLQWLKHTIKD